MNLTSPQELLTLFMNLCRAISFSFSQVIRYISVQRSDMHYTSGRFSLKSRLCWRWNHFVPIIILGLLVLCQPTWYDFTISSLTALLALLPSFFLIFFFLTISALFRFRDILYSNLTVSPSLRKNQSSFERSILPWNITILA